MTDEGKSIFMGNGEDNDDSTWYDTDWNSSFLLLSYFHPKGVIGRQLFPFKLMATKKPEPVPPKKKSTSIAGEILDGVGWVVAEIAMPVPKTLLKAIFGKKKKVDTKELKKKK